MCHRVDIRLAYLGPSRHILNALFHCFRSMLVGFCRLFVHFSYSKASLSPELSCLDGSIALFSLRVLQYRGLSILLRLNAVSPLSYGDSTHYIREKVWFSRSFDSSEVLDGGEEKNLS